MIADGVSVAVMDDIAAMVDDVVAVADDIAATVDDDAAVGLVVAVVVVVVVVAAVVVAVDPVNLLPAVSVGSSTVPFGLPKVPSVVSFAPVP